MKRKKKANPYNYKSLEALKSAIEKEFPAQTSGFYLKDFTESSMATTCMGVSATFEAQGSDLIRRVYRKSDTPESNKWDVDQVNSVNKPIISIPKKKEIPGHHINHSIEEDIMKRNQMTFEAIETPEGEFRLNTDKDGLVTTFINFEDLPDREN